MGLFFVCRLVWGFFPRSSSRNALTALNPALWADPVAALPGPFGRLLPRTRHGTLLPAPDLPQTRDLRICPADPGAAGRSPRVQRCPGEGGSWAETPSWNLLAGDTWGSGLLVWPPTCPQCFLHGFTAGGRVPPVSHLGQSRSVSELLAPSPVLRALGTGSPRFAL